MRTSLLKQIVHFLPLFALPFLITSFFIWILVQSVQASPAPPQASIQAGGKTQEITSGKPSQENFGPRIISEDDHGLVVEFNSPGYEIVEGRDGSGICQTIQSESLVDTCGTRTAQAPYRKRVDWNPWGSGFII